MLPAGIYMRLSTPLRLDYGVVLVSDAGFQDLGMSGQVFPPKSAANESTAQEGQQESSRAGAFGRATTTACTRGGQPVCRCQRDSSGAVTSPVVTYPTYTDSTGGEVSSVHCSILVVAAHLASLQS